MKPRARPSGCFPSRNTVRKRVTFDQDHKYDGSNNEGQTITFTLNEVVITDLPSLTFGKSNVGEIDVTADYRGYGVPHNANSDLK